MPVAWVTPSDLTGNPQQEKSRALIMEHTGEVMNSQPKNLTELSRIRIIDCQGFCQTGR